MENRRFFPLFVDINNRNCLVVGAGKIALKKIKKLLNYGARVEVIAPDILEEIYSLNIKITKRKFETADIDDRFLVVAGTDNFELNNKIVELCEAKGILVNNITSKTDMNTRFSAVIERENFQISISANGNPREAVRIKEYLKKLL